MQQAHGLLQARGGPAIKLRASFVGGCRNDGDRERLAELIALAEELGLSSCVSFHPNAPVATMRDILGKSTIGLHSMVDEHFGISVVDYLAAGCIPVAHDSGALRPLQQSPHVRGDEWSPRVQR